MEFTDYEIALRLFLACILGGVVGWTRERVHKPAGFRTHVLVALGSSLITIMSIYAFADFGTLPRDPARIAANIVTGIGFLGAGTIMREGSSVRGLTTAASIWVVAGIGMAIGSGMYFPAIVTTVLAFIILEGIIEKYFIRKQHNLTINISSDSKIREIGEILHKYDISIKHVSILPINNSEYISVVFSVRVLVQENIREAINELKKIEGIVSVQDNHLVSYEAK